MFVGSSSNINKVGTAKCVTDNVFNWLMGSNLYQLVSSKYSSIPNLGLSSFAYCYQSVILTNLANPKMIS
jgi:hypothetical protein